VTSAFPCFPNLNFFRGALRHYTGKRFLLQYPILFLEAESDSVINLYWWKSAHLPVASSFNLVFQTRKMKAAFLLVFASTFLFIYSVPKTFFFLDLGLASVKTSSTVNHG